MYDQLFINLNSIRENCSLSFSDFAQKYHVDLRQEVSELSFDSIISICNTFNISIENLMRSKHINFDLLVRSIGSCDFLIGENLKGKSLAMKSTFDSILEFAESKELENFLVSDLQIYNHHKAKEGDISLKLINACFKSLDKFMSKEDSYEIAVKNFEKFRSSQNIDYFKNQRSNKKLFSEFIEFMDENQEIFKYKIISICEKRITVESIPTDILLEDMGENYDNYSVLLQRMKFASMVTTLNGGAPASFDLVRSSIHQKKNSIFEWDFSQRCRYFY